MKKLIILILLGFTINNYSQNSNSQKWFDLAKNDISLQPEYGNVKKTKKQKESDQKFQKDILEQYKGDAILASKKMSELGFKLLYEKRDFASAMRRFNQAFLLNSKNSNAYYGFGTIYFNFGEMKKAREQYEKGLKFNPRNSEILTDYGTSYLGDYYREFNISKPEKLNDYLEKANKYLTKSIEINTKNSNTIYKLSIVNMNLSNCEKARDYLNQAKKMNNPNVTESYEIELNEKCRNNNLDCSSIKTGKFKIVDELSGLTLIDRDSKFQIEENKKYNYKLKLSVTWIDQCTYQLKVVEDLLNPENENSPKMILTCEIIEITENGYIQISSSDIDKTKIKKEVLKM